MGFSSFYHVFIFIFCLYEGQINLLIKYKIYKKNLLACAIHAPTSGHCMRSSGGACSSIQLLENNINHIMRPHLTA
jgi:hypothetical protein